MPDYIVSGLAVSADAPVPGLRAAAGRQPVDIAVSMCGEARLVWTASACESPRYISPERLDDGTPLLRMWTRPDGSYRLLYYEGAEFVVDRSASRVEVRWDAGLTDADVAVYLLGPVLGFALRLRGVVPLHASAVALDGRGVLFLGDAGAGKSTTAAAFATLEYPVLADDVVRIAEDGGRLIAYPSHPRVSMWPDAVASMFGAENALPQWTPTYVKRYLDLDADRRFRDEPVPIEVIYVLGARATDSPALVIEPLDPRSALMDLVSNTYGSYLLDAGMRAAEFDLLARVVRLVPVRRLVFGDGIEHLPESCRSLATRTLAEAAAERV